MMSRLLVGAVTAAVGWGLVGSALAAGPFILTVDVDVGPGSSIAMPMGPGGMSGTFMTGGGPIVSDGQQFGTLMHSTATATMQSMMGQQTLQHRMLTFDLPGLGTVFAMMAGGGPGGSWSEGKGIIMGGTDGVHAISGSFTVGEQVGPTAYRFTLTYSFS
jgi:hypothetical protein